MDNNFEKLILEKLDSMQSDISSMNARMDNMEEKVNKIDGIEKRLDNMEEDIKAVKKTALKVETELTPKVQTMLDLYAGLAEKVTISNDLHEEVKILRYEVDIIKQVLSAKQ